MLEYRPIDIDHSQADEETRPFLYVRKSCTILPSYIEGIECTAL
jgi:hypothetical protein